MSKHQIVNVLFAGLTIGYFFLNAPLYGIFILVAIWLFIITLGSFDIRLNYHLNAISKMKTSERIVAITFDDGPTSHTLQALELLEKHQQKATFFFIGQRIQEAPEIARKTIEKGHLIGNHTFSHSKNMGFKNTQEMIEEIERCGEIITEITGQSTVYFRPPFGVTNPNIKRAVQRTQQQVIAWNIRSLDTVKTDEDVIYQRIIQRIKPGSIILLHDTSDKTIRVLERLLQYMAENKYKSVRIDELLKLKQ